MVPEISYLEDGIIQGLDSPTGTRPVVSSRKTHEKTGKKQERGYKRTILSILKHSNFMKGRFKKEKNPFFRKKHNRIVIESNVRRKGEKRKPLTEVHKRKIKISKFRRKYMRKLVTIEKIDNVIKHPNADNLDIVSIKGWKCVTKRNEFKVEDYGVYHEIDSLLPVIDRYSFLAKGTSVKTTIVNGEEKKGYRLKTARLRGQISQGLILPLSLFPEITNVEVEVDVSEQLNIYKYEAPIPVHLAGEIKGILPGFIPKTDEERVQNCPKLLEQYKGRRFYLTTKIDGTSSTYFKYDKEFGVCGKNLEFKENDKVIFWNIAKRYNLKERLPDGYAIQAETAGEGVQHNRHLLKGVDSYVFYVFDINNYKYLGIDDMLAFVKELGMKTVPIIDDNFILKHTCDELLKIADAPCPFNQNVPQEGIVFRLYDSTEKITFKAISNEYLLKYGL